MPEALHASPPWVLILAFVGGGVFFIGIERDPGYGSICSGGRYDALASDGKKTYPGVGLSIGVSRLLAKLIGERGLAATRPTPPSSSG